VLDAIGQRYGIRPSDLLGEENPYAALTIDTWAATAGADEEKKARDRVR